MITYAYFNHEKLRMERRPLPDHIAQRICDTLLESKKWHVDPDLWHRVHREVIGEVRALPDPKPVELKELEPWVKEAIALREQAPPMSWRDLEKKLEKPQSTIRRAVAAALVTAGT
jgi:hypothetical protein